jgi:hypothetical protein
MKKSLVFIKKLVVLLITTLCIASTIPAKSEACSVCSSTYLTCLSSGGSSCESRYKSCQSVCMGNSSANNSSEEGFFTSFIKFVFIAILIVGVFFVLKIYISSFFDSLRATEQLRRYKEKLEAINTDTPFGKRRIDYYKYRANNFLNTKKWLSFRTGYFEKISTELVQQFVDYHDRKISNIVTDEKAYEAKLKKLKKEITNLQKIYSNMDDLKLSNNYTEFHNEFMSIVSTGKILLKSLEDGVEIDANVEDISLRFPGFSGIFQILQDSTRFGFYASNYSKKIFDKK